MTTASADIATAFQALSFNKDDLAATIRVTVAHLDDILSGDKSPSWVEEQRLKAAFSMMACSDAYNPAGPLSDLEHKLLSPEAETAAVSFRFPGGKSLFIPQSNEGLASLRHQLMTLHVPFDDGSQMQTSYVVLVGGGRVHLVNTLNADQISMHHHRFDQEGSCGTSDDEIKQPGRSLCHDDGNVIYVTPYEAKRDMISIAADPPYSLRRKMAVDDETSWEGDLHQIIKDIRTMQGHQYCSDNMITISADNGDDHFFRLETLNAISAPYWMLSSALFAHRMAET